MEYSVGTRISQITRPLFLSTLLVVSLMVYLVENFSGVGAEIRTPANLPTTTIPLTQTLPVSSAAEIVTNRRSARARPGGSGRRRRRAAPASRRRARRRARSAPPRARPPDRRGTPTSWFGCRPSPWTGASRRRTRSAGSADPGVPRRSP